MEKKFQFKIMQNIEEVVHSGTKTNKAIAMYLISLYKKKLELPKILSFSNNLDISMSAVSKFIKVIGVENYSLLRFIFSENTLENNNDKKAGDTPENILDKTNELINTAGRIMIVAEGIILESLKPFSTFLLKKGINAIYVESIETQNYISMQLNHDDLILCFAFGVNTASIRKILSNSFSKKILFTSNASMKQHADLIWLYEDISPNEKYSEFPYEILMKIQKDLKLITDEVSFKW